MPSLFTGKQQRDSVFLTSVPAAVDTPTGTATVDRANSSSRSRSRTPPPVPLHSSSSRYFTDAYDEQQQQQQQPAAVENDYLVWGPLDSGDSPQTLQKQQLQKQRLQQLRQGFAGSLMSTVQELVSTSIDMPSSGRSNALGAAERLEEMRCVQVPV
jgi:hypothetical protein